MNEKAGENCHTTQAVLALLHSLCEGAYAYHDITAGWKGSPEADARLLELKKTLRRINGWIASFLKGELVICADPLQPPSEVDVTILRLLAAQKGELTEVARQIATRLECLKPAPTEATLRFLAAAFARHAYTRACYFRCYREFIEKFSPTLDAEPLYPLFREALSDVAWIDALVASMQTAGKLADDTGRQLIERCLLLPYTFQSYAHEMNQLVGHYRGGFSFGLSDFSQEEAAAWRVHKFDAVEAGYWRAHGLDASEASAWMAGGVNMPEGAAIWKIYGFTPESAGAWIRRGLSPQIAAMWQAATDQVGNK